PRAINNRQRLLVDVLRPVVDSQRAGEFFIWPYEWHQPGSSDVLEQAEATSIRRDKIEIAIPVYVHRSRIETESGPMAKMDVESCPAFDGRIGVVPEPVIVGAEQVVFAGVR